MQDFQGKVVVITGASGGIGAAMAHRFSEHGARVVLGDVDQEGLHRTARELDPERTCVWPTDVSVEADVERLIAQTMQRFGRVDAMLANAGIEGTVKPLTELSGEEFARVLDVNVRGAFYCIKHAARPMGEQRSGVVVVTSSIAGLIGSAGLSAYVTSKHAVMGLVKSAAIELAAMNIRVVAINPGPIENRMMRSIEQQASPQAADQVKQAFEAKVPLGRYGTNEEVAALAAFLASDDASYCTGAAYVVDGGFTAQ